MKNKMKKFAKFAIAGCLAAMFALTGCGGNAGGYTPSEGGEEKLDPLSANYNNPLVLSTQKPDGVFNPFFSTSMVDSTILSMTQIGMLSTDKDGKLVYGQNEPSVAQDYSVRTVQEDGKTYTYYQFIIKNGIKFSDGKPLTIKDVLFNLYVYLDPVYTGSSTIYSTDIVGLTEYRTQQTEVGSGTMSAFDEARRAEAAQRITRLTNYVYLVSDSGDPQKNYDDNLNADQIKQVEQDFKTVGTEFRKELESDWNTVSSGMESYRKQGFTEAWQAFLTNDGGFNFWVKDAGGQYPVKDPETGNYTFDPANEQAVYQAGQLSKYLADNKVDTSDKNATEEATKAWAIDTVYLRYLDENMEYVDGDNLAWILSGWATASTILSQWTAEATTEYFNKVGEKVPNITGIQALKGGAFKASSESSAPDVKYGDDHDMLQIKINGVDPKAIYNFSFTVAPMHYYSSDNYTDEKGRTHHCISEFSVANNKFGLVRGDEKFFNNVLNDTEKGGIPMGAGVYRATNANGSLTPDRRGANGFWSNNDMVYLTHNLYFETVGTGIENSKIRLLRYSVVNSDQIINSLGRGDIHFGEPSATTDNIEEIDKLANVSHVEVNTNGYGYVGINAKYVPNITVRRAIMKAMDRPSIFENYYKGDLASPIERSMSTESWAYPDGATVYTPKGGGTAATRLDYSYDSTKQDIQKMLNSLVAQGYTLQNGIYVKGNDKLDYTFTIAGDSTDHPAYAMFLNAEKVLNSLTGIHVKVETSSTALSDLATGKLQVWAAAWTSTIDPDLYQVYHKDSRAASTLNWGYDAIKNDAVTYSYEQGIINELSSLINQGRRTNSQAERTDIYSDALDLIMELAVELPTYQRKDMFAFRSDILDVNTMQHNDGTVKQLSPYNGPLSRIWEVDYTEAYKAANQRTA